MLDHMLIDILGHSMGGMMALLYSLTYPEALKKLILVATGPHGFSSLTFRKIRGYNRVRLSLALWYAYMGLKGVLAKMVGRRLDFKEFILRYHDHAFPLYGIKEESWPRMRRLEADSIKSPMEVHESLMPDLQRFNVISRLPEIRAPTLTILGENDIYEQSLMEGSMLKKIPNSKLVVIPNAGHYVFLDETERFNQEIIHFLSV